MGGSTTDVESVKIVLNPEGSLQRAALMQSAQMKERRELKRAKEQLALDNIPRDIHK